MKSLKAGSFLDVILAFGLNILVFVTLALFIALPVWLIWNAIVPDIFGLKSITFLQALLLSLLSSFLFKSSSTSK